MFLLFLCCRGVAGIESVDYLLCDVKRFVGIEKVVAYTTDDKVVFLVVVINLEE